jgi:hypothetical protein
MSPDYFDTRFKLDLPLTELPESFAIITAYVTTGETWTAEENQVDGLCGFGEPATILREGEAIRAAAPSQ